MKDTGPTTLADLIEDRFGPDGTPLGKGFGADRPADGPLARILTRRTHRRYQERPVPDDLLQVLLACAFSTSAKSDLQQSGVVLVRDPAKRQAIADLIPRMPWIGAAPVFMVWIGDNRRIRRICEMRGKPFANDHLDSFLNAAADTALAMQTFILAAEAEGLGCCPISVVRDHAERIGEILALPDWTFPLAGLCLGWPAREGFVTARLGLNVNVHVDGYDDSDLPARVDEYDRRRDARFSIPRSEWKYLADYGEPEFYGWSEDKARQVSKPERDKLGAFVRGRKFDLR